MCFIANCIQVKDRTSYITFFFFLKNQPTISVCNMGSESQSGSPSGCPSVSPKLPDFIGCCVTTRRRDCIALCQRLLRWPGRCPRHPGAVFLVWAGPSSPGLWGASLTASNLPIRFCFPGSSFSAVLNIFLLNVGSVFYNPVSSHSLHNQ